MTIDNKRLFQGNQVQFSALYLFAVPIIIFLYFLQWKNYLFHGDDIYTYNYYINLHSFSEKMNLPASAGKFRPIHGLSLQLLIDSFGSNTNGYYWFNVFVHSINTLIFACLLNLYFKSYFISFLFSLLLGLSRFGIYNVTQLTNGGALEGLALMFFLAFLYFFVKWLRSDAAKSPESKNIFYSILFANLSTYTHERYIVLFPFLVLVVLFQLVQKKVEKKQAGLMISLIIASLLVNVVLKKYVFGMPFFLGTSSTQIDFSISTAFSFLKDGVSSIFLINTGPEYLVGFQFSSLSVFYKTLIISIVVFILSGIVLYLRREIKNTSLKTRHISPGLINFLLLTILFFLLLIPTVITVRLEQRWLQASFITLILFFVMAITSFKYRGVIARNILYVVFVSAFLIADHEYLGKGANNLFTMTSENFAAVFKKAIDNGTIRSSATKLYIWEKNRDPNNETAIRWTLGDGGFFELYTGKSKNIIFIDSVYDRTHSLADTAISRFNPQTDQIVYISNEIIDITNNFTYDSLKSFDVQRLQAGLGFDRPVYDSQNVIVNQGSFHDFYTDGFYDEENGIRWTNGNSSIGFIGGYGIKDSVYIELNTYLPPACKNILPAVSLIAENGKRYNTVSLARKGDDFFYGMYVEENSKISKIVIQSDTINSFPDLRKLSFPFLSIKLTQVKKVHRK